MAKRECDCCGREMAKIEKRKGVANDSLVKLLQLKQWQRLSLCAKCFPLFCLCCGRKIESLAAGKLPVELVSYPYYPDLHFTFGSWNTNDPEARVCAVCYKPLKEKKIRTIFERKLQRLQVEPTYKCAKCHNINDSVEFDPAIQKIKFTSRYCRSCRLHFGLDMLREAKTIDQVNQRDAACRGMRENYERTGLVLT